jgi:hypothetical protein
MVGLPLVLVSSFYSIRILLAVLLVFLVTWAGRESWVLSPFSVSLVSAKAVCLNTQSYNKKLYSQLPSQRITEQTAREAGESASQ